MNLKQPLEGQYQIQISEDGLAAVGDAACGGAASGGFGTAGVG